MKHIILGIKDYCKDYWHDFWFSFWRVLYNWCERQCEKTYVFKESYCFPTKEGSVWHYIRQRKIAQQRRKK